MGSTASSMPISNVQDQQYNLETAPTSASAMGLNLDCWLLICRQLVLFDLLQLAKASRALKELVQDYILPIKYKHTELNFKKTQLKLMDFRFFLDAIYGTAERVRLTQMPSTHFELLKLYCFPKVREMHVSLERTMKDTDLCSLSKIFPNLEILKPYGNFSGRHIELFTNVAHLSLACCHHLKSESLYNILLTMNLKSIEFNVFTKNLPTLSEQELTKLGELEMMSLNSYELSWLFQTKLAMPFKNVRKLIITELSKLFNVGLLFKNIGQTMAYDVYEMEIANNQYISNYIDPNEYEFLENVEKLKFINVRDIFCMFEDPSSFKALRKLSFYYCQLLEEIDFAAILTEAKQLEFLSFEECYCPEFIITETYLREAVKGRTKPLTLNWYSKSLVIKLTEYDRFPNLLKFTQRSHISSNYDPLTIKFRRNSGKTDLKNINQNK